MDPERNAGHWLGLGLQWQTRMFANVECRVLEPSGQRERPLLSSLGVDYLSPHWCPLGIPDSRTTQPRSHLFPREWDPFSCGAGLGWGGWGLRFDFGSCGLLHALILPAATTQCRLMSFVLVRRGFSLLLAPSASSRREWRWCCLQALYGMERSTSGALAGCSSSRLFCQCGPYSGSSAYVALRQD